MLDSDIVDRFFQALQSNVTVSLSRYDLVLAVIPTAFVVAVLASHLLSVPPRTLIVAASLVAALAVVDGLFFNPPTAGRRGQ